MTTTNRTVAKAGSPNLGSVNGQRVKAIDDQGRPLVNCSTCKGKGSYASGMVLGWRSPCVSCAGRGTRAAYGEWKKPVGSK